MRTNLYDVGIVGAGFAGLACARAAARRGLSRPGDRSQDGTGRTHAHDRARREGGGGALGDSRHAHAARARHPAVRAVARAARPGGGGLLFSRHRHAGADALVRARGGARGRASALRPAVSRRAAGRRRLRTRGLRRSRALAGRRRRADARPSPRTSAWAATANSCWAWRPSIEGVGGVDPDRLHCFLDSELARGYIGWVVPGHRGLFQVGLACRRPRRPDLPAFERRLARAVRFRRRAAARPARRTDPGRRPGDARRRPRRAADRRRRGAGVAAVGRRHPHGARIGLGGRAGDRRSPARRRGGPGRVLARSRPRFVAKRALRACWTAAFPTRCSTPCCGRGRSRRSRARSTSIIADCVRRKDGATWRRRCCAACPDRRRADAARRHAEQPRQRVDARHVVVAQQLEMAEGERREAHDVAGMAADAREPRRHAHDARRVRSRAGAQRRPDARRSVTLVEAAEVGLAPFVARHRAQPRDRRAGVARRRASQCGRRRRRHRVHGPARHRAQPARAEAAFAIEQRRPARSCQSAPLARIAASPRASTG